MLTKGFLSPGENAGDKLSVAQARFKFEQEQTRKQVLEQYTKEKTLKGLQSEVEKAKSDELAKKAAYERDRRPGRV